MAFSEGCFCGEMWLKESSCGRSMMAVAGGCQACFQWRACTCTDRRWLGSTEDMPRRRRLLLDAVATPKASGWAASAPEMTASMCSRAGRSMGWARARLAPVAVATFSSLASLSAVAGTYVHAYEASACGSSIASRSATSGFVMSCRVAKRALIGKISMVAAFLPRQLLTTNEGESQYVCMHDMSDTELCNHVQSRSSVGICGGSHLGVGRQQVGWTNLAELHAAGCLLCI